MKIKELSIIALIQFGCTLIVGLIISYFYPKAIEMSSLFWVALGVAFGRVSMQAVKNKFFSKKPVQMKS